MNLLASLSVMCQQGMDLVRAIRRLSSVRGVPGRMEYFGSPETRNVIVDYAHTPDALKQSLLTLRKVCRGRLVCVFGCGGNRDKGKRTLMGAVAQQYCDGVVITSDNPRDEDPEEIIRDILSGMDSSGNVKVEPDRAMAIRAAIESAASEDIVLVAGKGHETTQEIASIKYPFSDRQMVRNILGQGA